MKKIIIILIAVLVLLITSFIIINLQTANQNTNQAVAEIIENEPTGIIVPTESVTVGALDIVAIKPADKEQSINTETRIEIDFSRPFSLDEIEFFVNPNTPHATNIEGQKLVITPESKWDDNTLYTHSVNFTADNQKVRIYQFTTAGTGDLIVPNTYPEGLEEAIDEEQKNEHPDTFVANKTPYETTTFSITTDFEPQVPAHNYFIVTNKITDEQQVRQDVNVWLQSLDLTDEQIQSLDIRYQ